MRELTHVLLGGMALACLFQETAKCGIEGLVHGPWCKDPGILGGCHGLFTQIGYTRPKAQRLRDEPATIADNLSTGGVGNLENVHLRVDQMLHRVDGFVVLEGRLIGLGEQLIRISSVIQGGCCGSHLVEQSATLETLDVDLSESRGISLGGILNVVLHGEAQDEEGRLTRERDLTHSSTFNPTRFAPNDWRIDTKSDHQISTDFLFCIVSWSQRHQEDVSGLLCWFRVIADGVLPVILGGLPLLCFIRRIYFLSMYLQLGDDVALLEARLMTILDSGPEILDAALEHIDVP